MAENLQALIDKIRTESVDEAKRQAGILTAKAENEAAEIVDKAKKEAALIIHEAKEKAEAELRNGQAALERAARDVILSVGEQTRKLMETWLVKDVAEALPPERIAAFLDKFLASSPNGTIDISVPEHQKLAIEKALKNAFKREAGKAITITADASLSGGCKVKWLDSRVEFDFSAQAIAASMTVLVRSSLAETIRNAASGLK